MMRRTTSNDERTVWIVSLVFVACFYGKSLDCHGFLINTCLVDEKYLATIHEFLSHRRLLERETFDLLWISYHCDGYALLKDLVMCVVMDDGCNRLMCWYDE
jgi:hypothetical protein